MICRDEDIELDETHIDVCLSCGRYYGTTQKLVDLWRDTWHPRDGEVMPQICYNCMEDGR